MDKTAQPKRPLKVFLCHAHADRDPVRGLYTRLTQDGVDAWLDKAKLLPGQDWKLEIERAVREADVVVVCLSKQFNQAGFRQKEVRLALDTAMEKPEGEIFIIPARLEECDNLESLRKWHWVDLFEDDGYEMLMRALRARADKIGAVLQIKKNTTSPRIIQNKPSVATQIGKQEETSKTRAEVNKQKSKLNLKRLIANIGLIVLGVTGILAFVLPFLNPPTQSIKPTPASSVSPTSTTLTPTSLPIEIADDKNILMVLVPTGEFIMGVNDGLEDESPAHTVFLDDYYIDQYEVTNAEYAVCVRSGECKAPYQESSYTQINYFNNPQYESFPVIYVDWNMANTFCEWREARLPSEAEWEKAARGVNENLYPWGNELHCSYANYYGCAGDTTKVGSYESGKSPYGVYDMAGNVFEWVADWYSEVYYTNLPDVFNNPIGPASGVAHVIRGGTFIDDHPIRTAYRFWAAPEIADFYLGFRCVRELP